MHKKCANCGKIHTMKTDICDKCGSMKFVPVAVAKAVPAQKKPEAKKTEEKKAKGKKDSDED